MPLTESHSLRYYSVIKVELSFFLRGRFVKREIRSLTILDRERFLDAASALWKYNQTAGQAKFGPKFTSIGISNGSVSYNLPSLVLL